METCRQGYCERNGIRTVHVRDSYVFYRDGYRQKGFVRNGYDREGYNAEGLDALGARRKDAP